MKTTVYFSEFCDYFHKIRPDNFSYQGLRVLFDHIEEIDNSCGEDSELDVIGLCCDFAESDWQTYWGSCKPLLEDIKRLGEDKFYKEILDLAWSSKHLSYLEAKYQFKTDVLETNSYNDNIQARYYRKDLATPSSIDIL